MLVHRVSSGEHCIWRGCKSLGALAFWNYMTSYGRIEPDWDRGDLGVGRTGVGCSIVLGGQNSCKQLDQRMVIGYHVLVGTIGCCRVRGVASGRWWRLFQVDTTLNGFATKYCLDSFDARLVQLWCQDLVDDSETLCLIERNRDSVHQGGSG